MKKSNNEFKPYFLGIDIGTDSVGYAVTNTDYTLCKFRGEPMWGVTLFDSAEPCGERRAFRSARRRLARRRQRVKLLQEFFCGEINKVDSGFYKKISESALYPEDKTCEASCVITKDYKTIHHLICELMKPGKKHDIRLIYAACAWLVAHRGHFLSDMDPENTDAILDLKPTYESFLSWFEENGLSLPWECDLNKIADIICRKDKVAAKESAFCALAFGAKKPKDNAEEYPISRTAVIKLLCGGTIKLGKLFIADERASEINKSVVLSDADGLQEIIAEFEEGAELLKRLSALYDCATLSVILSGHKSISDAKVSEYEKHKKDLKELKCLLRKYDKTAFDEIIKSFCKGTDLSEVLKKYEDDFKIKIIGLFKETEPEKYKEAKESLNRLLKVYDSKTLSEILGGHKSISDAKVVEYEKHKNDLKQIKDLLCKYDKILYNTMFRDTSNNGYSAYVGKSKSVKREDFYDFVKSIVSEIEKKNESDKTIEKILSDIENKTYMPKQVNGDNRVIPHQLYYAELCKILENASEYYGFLKEKDKDGYVTSEKIKSIFLFKIPYFVGPLNSKKFGWIAKKSEEKIYPWNFEKVVDFDKCEQEFINRMTNTCTYLSGADVAAGNSLLYCKYSVLNEINPLKINGRPISTELKQRIFNEVFMPGITNKPKVTYKTLVKWLVANGIIKKGDETSISGIDTEIKSSMKPMFDFYRLMKEKKLKETEVEEIIKYSTYTEDKGRFKKWLGEKFELSAEDIRYISGKNYSGFGRLSEEFLNVIEGTDRETGETGTIMHFMWSTNDNLMQILSDKYTFREIINKRNRDYYDERTHSVQSRLDDMGVSNAVKRPVLRALEVIDDITKAKKSVPEKIFVEMPRGGAPEQKKRTDSRQKQLTELYKSIKKDADVQKMMNELNSLGDDANSRLRSEALFLYFTQLGKCAYCGKPINIDEIKSGSVNIDHIWPQAYVKDDSIHNNKVLVHSPENKDKGDVYPIKSEWQNKMRSYWDYLLEHKLITAEKHRRLIRNTPFSDEEKNGFINRQLVETSQSAKALTLLLTEKYPDTEIVYVKAKNVSEFRHKYGEIKNKAGLSDDEKNDEQLIKCRTVNDVHHAHDAYLNIIVGNVFNEKFTKKFNVAKDKYSLNYRVLFGKELRNAPEVWSPQKHIAVVDKVMNTKFVHLTKYQTKKKGKLFDIQPVSAKPGLVPRKKGLDPAKYGGYNKPSMSFFSLVKYTKGKKTEVTFLPVDLLCADKFENDAGFAEKYIKDTLGNIRDLSFPLGKRIIKINTVLSLDGFEVCISGKGNGGALLLLRSLTTLYLPHEHVRYAKALEKTAEKLADDKKYKKAEEKLVDDINYGKVDRLGKITSKENLELFKFFAEKLSKKPFSKIPGAKIVLDENEKTKFCDLTIKKQIRYLNNLVLYFKTNRSGDVDLSKDDNKQEKHKSKTGALYISANLSNWKYDDVRIIDRSASGLFEKVSGNLKEIL